MFISCHFSAVICCKGQLVVYSVLWISRLEVDMKDFEWREKINSDDGMKVMAGQDMVMCGYIGMQGTVCAAKNCRKKLICTLPKDFVDKAAGLSAYIEKVTEVSTVSDNDITAVYQVESGGIFDTLWRISEDFKTGLTVYLKKIPVKQETIEICEVFDVNPYQLLSKGCFIYMTHKGNSLVEHFMSQGINAAIIGSITDSKDRIVLNGEGVRHLNRPEPDEIYKFDEAL